MEKSQRDKNFLKAVAKTLKSFEQKTLTKCGLTPKRLLQIENGETDIKFSTIIKVTHELGISADEFFRLVDKNL